MQACRFLFVTMLRLMALAGLMFPLPLAGANETPPAEADRVYNNVPLCERRDRLCEASFGRDRRVRIPLELLFEHQMWRHTPIFHLIGRGPTQESAILPVEFQALTGRPAPPGDRRVRISIKSPAFPRSIDEEIVYIDHYEQAEAIRVARRDGADARIVTRQPRSVSGEFELIIRRGRVVSRNWCQDSGAWCTIRAVRGDVAVQVGYDPRGAPGTDAMIGFAVDFANRFIVQGPPIPRDEAD